MPQDFDPLFAVAFEGLPATDKDVFSLGTLQFLLGGGRAVSFEPSIQSLTSRLNRNLIEKTSDVTEVNAFNFNYSDAGLFGVQGIAKRGALERAIFGVSQELSNVSKVTEEEVAAAKAQLKSNILFYTDTRAGLLEFVGRQALLNNPQSPFDYVKGIDSVR